MRRGILRSVAIVGYVAWSAKSLGCDPSSTNGAFVDTDGDGLSDTDELVIYGTSPLLADTDGDGMTDYAEIVVNAFDPTNAPLRNNPRVADIPRMEVLLTSPPLISLHLTESNGETRTIETSQLTENIYGVSQGIVETTRQAETIGVSDTVSREVGSSISLGRQQVRDAGVRDAGRGKDDREEEEEDREEEEDDRGGPVMASLSDGVSSTVERANTVEVSVALSETQSQEIREALTEVQAYAESHDISAAGGLLRILVRIVNRGALPFRTTNLLLSASLIRGNGIEAPVGNLDLNTSYNNFQPYAIAPGESLGPVNFTRELLTLEQVDMLVRDIRALVIRIGVYELADATGRSYAFDVGAINARTATVSVDYGDALPPERHLVATNLDPARPGVTARRVLEEILRIPFTCDRDGVLTTVREIDAAEAGRWTVTLRHDDGSRVATTAFGTQGGPYSFADIVIRAGDVLRLSRAAP